MKQFSFFFFLKQRKKKFHKERNVPFLFCCLILQKNGLESCWDNSRKANFIGKKNFFCYFDIEICKEIQHLVVKKKDEIINVQENIDRYRLI